MFVRRRWRWVFLSGKFHLSKAVAQKQGDRTLGPSWAAWGSCCEEMGYLAIIRGNFRDFSRACHQVSNLCGTSIGMGYWHLKILCGCVLQRTTQIYQREKKCNGWKANMPSSLWHRKPVSFSLLAWHGRWNISAVWVKLHWQHILFSSLLCLHLIPAFPPDFVVVCALMFQALSCFTFFGLLEGSRLLFLLHGQHRHVKASHTEQRVLQFILREENQTRNSAH